MKRPPLPAILDLNCQRCGAPFKAKLKRAMYCSDTCRVLAQNSRKRLRPTHDLLAYLAQQAQA